MVDEITTGSLIPGAIVGTSAWQGLTYMNVNGNPSGLIIAAQASGLAYDMKGGSLYMALTTAGKDWIALGSVAY
jgi:hypothetical protein